MSRQFEKGNMLYGNATGLRDSGQYIEAIDLYKEALMILEPVVNAPLRICLLFDLALAFDFFGSYQEARQNFQRAVELYEDLKRVCPLDPGVNDLAALVGQIEEQLSLSHGVSADASDYLEQIDIKRWSKNSIRVYIDQSKEGGFQPDSVKLIWQGFNVWFEEFDKLSLKTVEIENEADLFIWRRLNSDGPAAGQTLFETSTASDGMLEKIDKVSIYMNTDMEENKFVSLAAHELGHALGLDGHSPFGDDLMYFKSQRLTLSSRDRKSLAKLYA